MSIPLCSQLLAAALLLCSAAALTVTIGPASEECFIDEANVAAKVLGSFRVTKGGNLDIDVKMWNPDNTIVYEQDKQVEGSFMFVALQKGQFRLCFSNRMSTVTSKDVSFNLYVGSSLTSHGVAKQEHFTPLENSVLVLSEGLKQVQNEQKYISTRERVCRDTTESTWTRLWAFTMLNALAAVIVAVWQIIYLKRLFEQKGQK